MEVEQFGEVEIILEAPSPWWRDLIDSDVVSVVGSVFRRARTRSGQAWTVRVRRVGGVRRSLEEVAYTDEAAAREAFDRLRRSYREGQPLRLERPHEHGREIDE